MKQVALWARGRKSNPIWFPYSSVFVENKNLSLEISMNQSMRAGVCALLLATGGFAASHRNGPLLLEDQTANLNDYYLFRSWETGRSDRVVMSMSAQGFQNPSNGPSYYKFSDSVLYRFNVNNARGLDGNPDLQIDFVFQTQLRPNPTFVSYFGALKGIDDPGILLYQTFVVVIRNLKTNQGTYF